MTLDCKAAVCRALALLPDTRRRSLAAAFRELLPAEAMARYLLDHETAAIGGADGPLLAAIGPRAVVPIDDVIAALVAAPAFVDGEHLHPDLIAHRFAPRADDAVALAIAELALPAQVRTLEQLFADGGPDADLLALSTVQCGRVLAWSPHLLDLPIADTIVDALLALLDPGRPRPLLDAVARALGPIAMHSGTLPDRVRGEALSCIAADDDLAAACGYILGCAAPRHAERYALHRSSVLDMAAAQEVFVSFLDGLIAAAHVPAVCELVAGMLDGDEPQVLTALAIADVLPLDPLAPRLVAELAAASPARRAAATGAVEMFGGDEIDRALAERLADDEPDVVAAVARTMIVRGRAEILAAHTTRDMDPVRRAISLSALGDLRTQTIDTLAASVLSHLDNEETASPLVLLVGDALLRSARGLEVATELIAGAPEVAGVLALASAAAADRDAAISAPPDQRARLARSVLELSHVESELAALALYVLARVSAGDEDLADIIGAELALADAPVGHLLAALGELRVASDVTASAVLPRLIAGDDRVAAAEVCGRVLPSEHPAWDHVRGLLGQPGASASAWTALRDRARRQDADYGPRATGYGQSSASPGDLEDRPI